MLRNFIEAQSFDPDGHQAVTSIGKQNLNIAYDSNGVFVRVSAIGRASQQLLHAVVRPRTLRICHYYLLTGQLEGHYMYDTMRRNFY